MGLLSRLTSSIGRIEPAYAVVLFTFINVLNYLDRGIVPGAFESIGDFIRQDLNTNDTDVQLGLLQSMYIVGYAVASLSFGHLVHTYPPFRLMAVGLGIWVCAVLMSGWAPHFWVLVVARVLSGVGEASFQTVVPPYIDDNAPSGKRGLWLSLFFMAIPVGTAVGYAWGGNVATALTWRWAFFLEAIPMLPLISVIWFIPYRRGDKERGNAAWARSTLVGDLQLEEVWGSGEAPGVAVERTADGAFVVGVSSPGPRTPSFARLSTPLSTPFTPFTPPTTEKEKGDVRGRPSGIDVDEELAMALGEGGREEQQALNGTLPPETGPGRPRPSFRAELVGVLTEPVYMSIVLGYAGYTAVLAGMGSFGPTITKGLGLFSDQSTASLYFGGAVSIAGAIGTPLGGYLIDRSTRLRKIADKERRAAQARGREAAVDAAKLVLDSPGTEEGVVGGGTPHQLGTSQVSMGSTTPDDAEDPSVADMKMLVALPQAVFATALGTAGCMAGIMAGTTSGGLFFTFLGLGALALCSTTAGINQSIMAAVRPESRSFAIGLGTLLLHAFGDVPAPPIIGAIADRLSPQTCVSAAGATAYRAGGRSLAGGGGLPAMWVRLVANSLAQSGPTPLPPLVSQSPMLALGTALAGVSDVPSETCTRNAAGLQVTLLITLSWLVWPILLWSLAWYLSARRKRIRDALEEGEGGEGGPSINGRYSGYEGGSGREGSATVLLSADRLSGAMSAPAPRIVNGLKGGAVEDARDWDGMQARFAGSRNNSGLLGTVELRELR